jgi:hypothetical protein
VINTAIFIKLTNPKLATIPRHIGVIPCQPCQTRTIGTEARCGIEIIARNQNLYLSITIQRHTDQHVGLFAFSVGMVFTDTDQTIALMIHDEISVTPI